MRESSLLEPDVFPRSTPPHRDGSKRESLRYYVGKSAVENAMLRRNLVIAAAAAALLGGCAYDYDRDDYVVSADVGYHDYGYRDYGYRDSGYRDVYYDGYYDGYYGPFYDGYWGTDGFFYFSDVDGHFNRDAARHFRHSPDAGFTRIRGHADQRSNAMPNHP
jgi:hypothetical protein